MTLDELWTGSGAAAWGTCAYRDLLPAMDEAARAKAAGLCPDPAGVFVAAYPYFPGDTPGNLSLYARGQDYHVAIPRRMEQVCEGLRTLYPGRTFVRMVDNSPLPERMCAGLAGVGLRGRNGMTIVPPWGTYLFLGVKPYLIRDVIAQLRPVLEGKVLWLRLPSADHPALAYVNRASGAAWICGTAIRRW